LPFAFEEIAFSAISSKALFSGSDVSIRTFLTFYNKHSAINLTIFIYGFSSFYAIKQLCYLQKDTSTSNFKLPFTTSLQYKMTQKVQK
jgi:hypothetical protein